MPDFAFRKGSHIKSAAIHVGRLVYTGHTHADAFIKAQDEGMDPEELNERVHRQQVGTGFVSNTNRFLDRAEAHTMARKSKQTEQDFTPQGKKYKPGYNRLLAEYLRRNPDDSVWNGEKLK